MWGEFGGYKPGQVDLLNMWRFFTACFMVLSPTWRTENVVVPGDAVMVFPT